MPKVSVIIPTYNRKDTLPEAIDSVLQQTYQDFEIIVVDHGSTDGSAAMVTARYGKSIRVLETEFCPYPACPRNRGIQVAEGTYIAFLDSDDLWRPHKLAMQIDALESDHSLGWSYGKAERFGQGVPAGTPEIGRWQVHTGNVLRALLMLNFIPSCTVLVRKECLDSVGHFDTTPGLRSAEDYECWIRLAARYPVHAVKNIIARYRVSSDNTSKTLTSRYGPEKLALELAASKLNLSPGLLQQAMASLHLRLFRYTLSTDSAAALSHLNKSLALNPRRFRTLLYKSIVALAGARAAQNFIKSEQWLKRCIG
jgi:glycosyltransferase involved in cell wall biosynthesis